MKINSLILSFMIIFTLIENDQCLNSKNEEKNLKFSKKNNGKNQYSLSKKERNLNNENSDKYYIENDPMNSLYGKINVKKIKRDSTDYSGDNLHAIGFNTVYTPLVRLPPPVKNEKMDELPVIWQSGPLKGKIMTEDDFPKPFGYYYSEYKLLHPEN